MATRTTRSQPWTALRRRPSFLRHVAVRLGVGGLVLYLALTAVGLGITRLTVGRDVVGDDSRIARWFLAHRTPGLDAASHVGSMLADTATAVALAVLSVVALRWWLHRWRESVVVLTAILGELFVFLLVTNTVDRPRPPVPHLDPAPPTSSFPSGHTAAATALYGALAVVLLRTLARGEPARRMLGRGLAAVCWCVPVIVALSRMYRGMHYLSDVVFGAIGGGLWLLLVLVLLYPRPGPERAEALAERDATRRDAAGRSAAGSAARSEDDDRPTRGVLGLGISRRR